MKKLGTGMALAGTLASANPAHASADIGKFFNRGRGADAAAAERDLSPRSAIRALKKANSMKKE